MKPKTLCDILRDWNQEEVDYAETAYRRGFTHAVSSSLIAMQAGATTEDFESWLRRVMEWRESPKDFFPPPNATVAATRSCQLRHTQDDVRRLKDRERQRKHRQRLKESQTTSDVRLNDK